MPGVIKKQKTRISTGREAGFWMSQDFLGHIIGKVQLYNALKPAWINDMRFIARKNTVTNTAKLDFYPACHINCCIPITSSLMYRSLSLYIVNRLTRTRTVPRSAID